MQVLQKASKVPTLRSLEKLLSKYNFSNTRLQIFDGSLSRNSMSGIRATIFGATGFVGPYVGAALGYISSDVIFPHCHRNPYDDEVKELKLSGGSGYSFIVKNMDFNDQNMIDRVIKNSNVVINLVGPRPQIKTRDKFEYVNITIAKRIAEACSRNPGVKRLIHFSACGAKADSPSQDFATKFLGEQEVTEAFPNVTILRPATVFGRNDHFTRNIFTQRDYLYQFNIVTDDCTSKRQPIYVSDVAQAVLNALKLEETAGRTYELGGPHEYTMLEIYEILQNIIRRPPKLVHVPYDLATKIAQVTYNWEHWGLEKIVKARLDQVVDPKARKIDELFVKPIAFKRGVEKYFDDHKARFFGNENLDDR